MGFLDPAMSDPHPALMFLAAVGVSLLAKLPLGSISILTIQRAMTLGFRRAFLPTLGAMARDKPWGQFSPFALFISSYSFCLKRENCSHKLSPRKFLGTYLRV